MFFYKMVIAYDGTGYYGWQIQPRHVTITRVLVDTFYRVFGKHIKITGASRTDAGVHALGQIASFATDLYIDPIIMARAWNGLLPVSIMIRKISCIQQAYNPRARVQEKVYYYHFFLRRPLPFASPYGYFVQTSVSLSKLTSCLALFQGTHDFRSFCSGYEKENTIRTIHSISLIYLQNYRCYRIIFKGPGFLKYMIRRIIGACLHVAATDTLSEAVLMAALKQKNPLQKYKTAPAHGLMLASVRYQQD